ncbi:MAG TPA: hypothetical protein VJ913_11795 [Actinomycetota bacterium]|nr:hypothetical protein [Actinomycetota bacterium]
MDRQAMFLLALGLLIAAATVVSVAGWILFVRDRRADRAADHDVDDDAGTEGAEDVSPMTDR